MGTRDPRVDDYIAGSAEFARPILERLRGVVHAACPEVEETMKWGFPHFMYEGMLCSMASFKQHCAFGFWKGELVVGRGGEGAAAAMGQFGRITALADLPAERVLAGYVREAMRLNEEGPKGRVKPKRAPRTELAVPDYFDAALRRDGRARAAFERMSASDRREYVEWVTEAKRDETRERRLATAIEWIAEGKRRNWKYERK